MISRRVSTRVAFFALLASTLLLSGQTCDEGTAGQCVPGRIVTCPCPDGSDGIQECADDNTYGACVCFAADAGTGGDVGDVDEGDVGESDDANNGDTDASDVDTELPYYFLRISSNSDASGASEDPGPDIDAISLTKDGGATYWAGAVVDEYRSSLGSGNASEMSLNLLGEADDVSLQGDSCQVNAQNYYSVGQTSDYVTVSFEQNAVIEAGDTVTVYEVGDCLGPNGIEPWAEPFAIEVGTSARGELWSLVASSAVGPVVRYTLTESELPPVSAD
jgi:hypothetical protein